MARDFIKNHRNDPNYFKDIALKYASNIYISMEKVAKYYDISTDNVQTAIRLAITMYLITYLECVSIRKKSDDNQQAHYISGSRYTGNRQKHSQAAAYYDQLFAIRRKNIIKNYTDKQIRHVVDVYLKNPNSRNVWDKLGLSKEEMNGVLEKGCIFGIISDKKFDELRKVSLSKARSQNQANAIQKGFNRITDNRETRKGILKNINAYQKQLSMCDGNEDLEKKLKYERNYLEWFDNMMLEAI